MIYTETLLLAIYEDILTEFPFYRPDKNYLSQLPNNQYNELPEYKKISNKYDLKFIWDMGYKVYLDKILSTKQYDLLLTILPKYNSLYTKLGIDIQQYNYWLNCKDTKSIKLYESKNIKREVRYIKNNTLAFRFIYSPDIAKLFKEINKKSPANLSFIREHDIWLLDITEKNYNDITNLISSYGFEFDDSVENYLLEYENTKGNPVEIKISDNKCDIIVTNNNMFVKWLERELLLGARDAS